MNPARLGVVSALFFLFLSGCSQHKETSIIPRRILFGNPASTDPQISPDSKRLAYLAPADNAMNIWVRELDGCKAVPVTREKEPIQQFFWSQDSREIFYLKDSSGDENWHLYGVDSLTGKVRRLADFPGVRVEILQYTKFVPGQMLLGMNKDDRRFQDVYLLDIATGELSLAAKNPGNFASWVADPCLRILGATSANDRGGYDFLVRKDSNSPWVRAASWGLEDSDSGPVAMTHDGRRVYLVDWQDANAGKLVEMDLATLQRKVIAGDPHYDVYGIMINPDTSEVEAVSFFRERNDWIPFGPKIGSDFANLRKTAPGDFSVISRDNSDRNWIVSFNADTCPASYYLYRRDQGKAVFLFESMPELKGYVLAATEPFSFVSRDGLTIRGYLTFPPGKPRKRLPAVLNVHGGPWSRDLWGYNPVVQWLANRGYLCIQVNYRGSTGYGKDFLNAGNKQWGAKMQDDLTDAVHWVIRKGIADPGRIAIYGRSYGGYASLAGITLTPELFACAVDCVGPSNLLTFLKSIPPYWESYLKTMHLRIGDPATEAEMLRSRSPLFNIGRIRVPVLIAQGANDPRVNRNESEQIVSAMRASALECEYLLFPDEGHVFVKPENRMRFYGAAEKFLARILKGRYED